MNNITAGAYTVTVTDANGCTKTTSATIMEPPVIVLSNTTVNSTCGNPNGSIDLTVTGGVYPYTYLWSTGATIEDPVNYYSGIYTVTVTDANGCSKTSTATINNTGGPSLSTFVTNILCNGAATGAVNLTVTGGTDPFNFIWSNSASIEDINNLVAGTYTVTVTDVNGCTKTTSATVTEPPALTLSTVVTNVLCNGFATGAINLTVTGGTGSTTYLWSNGFTGQDPSNLSAGTYTVTVTDVNGCTKSTSATVTEPPALALTTVVTNVLCNGAATGEIDLAVTGGTGNKTFIWSSGQTTEDLTGLLAGTYTVTVTDVNGCTKTTSATVTQPTSIALSNVATNVLCNGAATGAIDLTATGGTGSKTYLWSNGFTGQDPSGLIAGTYTVTVTDANGCTKTTSATITEPPALALSTAVTNVLCNGAATGAINLTVTGGTGSKTYLWSSGQTTEDLSNLIVGTYTVTVTDANGCTKTTSATVTQPTEMVLSATTENTSCNGADDCSIDLSLSGGVPAYTYLWSNGFTGQDPGGLLAGTYTVTVTDANNCTKTISATVIQPSLSVDLAVPSICDPLNNNYSVVVTVSWTNAPTNAITVTTTEGGNSVINIVAGSSGTQMTTVTGLTSNGVTDVDVTASFTPVCFATLADAYDAPLNCTPASIGNFVWDDQNGNGIQDGGEPGISGVTVTLTGTDQMGNPVTQTTTTGSNGEYSFDDLVPGTYKITFTTPAGGYVTTPVNQGGDDTVDSDADPAMGGMTANEILTPGENNTDYDAGYYLPAEIGNYVWEDTNANGQQDGGEPGIGGVPVTLNGTTGTGQTVTETTTTDGNGFYLFSGLQPGTYTITFGTPTGGYVLTSVDQGGDDTNDSDAQPGSQTTVAEVLTSGESNLTYDAGFYLPASLGDYVWSDTDGDGVQDGGEPGIGGVTVTLSGTTGDGSPVNLTTSTDGTGFYEFTDLAPGTYTVTFTTPGGSTATTPNEGGDDTLDSDADPVTGAAPPVTLVSGENNPTIDAGFLQVAEIGNYVWEDTNANGAARRRGAGHRRRAGDLKRHDGHRPNGYGDDDNRRQWFLPVQRPATGHIHDHFWYPNRRLCADECGSGVATIRTTRMPSQAAKRR
ncbi:MAG: carboxypeptidase regulatory-like domain-containing protein [Lewinellaceae bacterium]|nr:carboxypeptidase regulatory-like domain-containing protein [Lewinellaceae bacterium]